MKRASPVARQTGLRCLIDCMEESKCELKIGGKILAG